MKDSTISLAILAIVGVALLELLQRNSIIVSQWIDKIHWLITFGWL